MPSEASVMLSQNPPHPSLKIKLRLPPLKQPSSATASANPIDSNSVPSPPAAAATTTENAAALMPPPPAPDLPAASKKHHHHHKRKPAMAVSTDPATIKGSDAGTPSPPSLSTPAAVRKGYKRKQPPGDSPTSISGESSSFLTPEQPPRKKPGPKPRPGPGGGGGRGGGGNAGGRGRGGRKIGESRGAMPAATARDVTPGPTEPDDELLAGGKLVIDKNSKPRKWTRNKVVITTLEGNIVEIPIWCSKQTMTLNRPPSHPPDYSHEIDLFIGGSARDHEKEFRPFQCTHSGCTKSFSTLEQLSSHERKIHGEAEFVCGIDSCTRGFVTSGQLVKHQKMVHFRNPRKKKGAAAAAEPGNEVEVEIEADDGGDGGDAGDDGAEGGDGDEVLEDAGEDGQE